MNPTFAQTVISLELRNSAAFETSPPLITEEIAAFLCPAGLTVPVRVPVEPRTGAEAGWCFRNVAEAVKAEGGRAIVGWLGWAAAHYMSTEYHSVWETPDGRIIDPTPKADGENYIVFGADPEAGPDFDYLTRPRARRLRTYQGRSRIERARDAISCFSKKELLAKRSRACKAGLSIDEWVAARLPVHDELEIAVDRFLACSNKIEKLLTPSPDGMMCSDLDAYHRLLAEKTRLLRRFDAVVARRCTLGITSPTRLSTSS